VTEQSSPKPPEQEGPSRDRDWRGVAQLGLVLIFLFALAGGIALLVRRGAPPGVEVTPTPVDVRADVTVHLTGAVTSPGVYTLPDGGRLQDAVSAAGGLAKEADQERVNLATRLRDGEQYHIPRLGAAPDQTPGLVAPPASTLVNLNTASAEQLATLPGIGATRAQAIVAYRQQQGPFQRVEDLLAVSGIGPSTLERLRSLVTVD
jgi:competence protein ComEA